VFFFMDEFAALGNLAIIETTRPEGNIYRL
jgi:type IV secretory pathway TraG/TraD family ATPase VirD4